MAIRLRYVYETSFFDVRPAPEPLDQVDYAINHPILERTLRRRQREPKQATRQEDGGARHAIRQHRSGLSSLEASASSLEQDADSAAENGESGEAILLSRSRSLRHDQRQSGAFSLHLSPVRRTRISEPVLSPISDKSENGANQDHGHCSPAAAAAGPLLVPSLPVQRRRPHLAPLAFAKHGLALTGSDSGISVSANSLEASSDALTARCCAVPAAAAPCSPSEHLSSSSEPLPFLMPKLKRSPAILQTLGPAFQATGRPLSLTLPFPAPPAGGAAAAQQPAAPLSADEDLANDSVPLQKQSWYHGSITRRDAESRLKPAPAGAFLVRDSMASDRDYFLAARSENGFLHVRIDCQWNESDELDFALSTLPERRFSSVAAIVNHCANVGVYCPSFPPLVFKYPLAEEAF